LIQDNVALLDSQSTGVVVSILSIAQSVLAVCIALSFIHFKYFKSAVLEEILLELNLITKNLGGDDVVKAATFSGIFVGATALAPIVIGILCQAYVHIETILMDAFGSYVTLLAIFTQICKVILVAKICSELYKIMNSKLKVNLRLLGVWIMNYNFGFKAAATSPPKNIIQFLLNLRRIHSKISAVMDLTDYTFRTSILLSTVYCTFEVIFATFYPLSVIFGKDEILLAAPRLFLVMVINISFVLGVAILYIWFSWQCEEAVGEVIFLFGLRCEI
jgi:hypothetical protein